MRNFIIVFYIFALVISKNSFAQLTDHNAKKLYEEQKESLDINQQVRHILEVTGQVKAIRQSMLEDYLNPILLYSNNFEKASVDKIRNELSEDEISKKLIIEFKRRFTDSEIKAIYDFSKSPAGSKYLTLNKHNQLTELLKGSLDTVKMEILRLEASSSVDKVATKSIYTINRPDGFYRVLNYNKVRSLNELNPSDFSKYELETNASISTSDIEIVKDTTIKDESYRVIIDIVLGQEGALKFEKLTAENIGKPIAIVVDKTILLAPIINATIKDGQLQISGDFSVSEAKEIVKKLQRQIENR